MAQIRLFANMGVVKMRLPWGPLPSAPWIPAFAGMVCAPASPGFRLSPE